MAQAASKTCDICVSGPGYNYCEQCDQLFCDGCKISHLRTKMSKEHTFQSGPNINPEVKQYCKEHDENFIYYCLECHTPICKICVIKKHKSHDFAEIKESTEGIKAEVKKDIETKIRNIQSNIAEVDQGSHTYQADVKEVIQAIKEEGRKLKEMIDKKIEALINTVRRKDAKNVQNLQSVGNELKTALDKAKEQQKFYQDTQRIKDTTKLLQKLKQIKSQIEQIEEIQIPVMPSVKYAQQEATESEIEKLFGELTFGERFRRKENPKSQKDVRFVFMKDIKQLQQHVNNTDTDAWDAEDHSYSRQQNTTMFPIGVDHEEEVQVLNSRNFTQWREGRRVVELGILADGLRACAKCGLPLQLGHTTSILTCGLSAILKIPCSNTVCSHVNNIPTGKRQERIWDANVKLATASINAGLGERQVNTLLSGLNIPPVSHCMMSARQKDVGVALQEVAKETVDQVLCEEIELTKKNKDQDSITAAVDAGWQMRGSGRSYNSLSGHCSVIGTETGKILNYAVRIKSCRVCSLAEKSKSSPPAHECHMNWSGSAKSMEADMVTEMVKDVGKKGVSVSSIVGDEDSTTIARLRANVD
ncbi:unnamed protein product [Mytilus coruscus]|uniref:B box-type domain-containing protein n=1 Tax=Mytilus coruscus TaxID=42192 RepID=A0A6J8B6S6_MYTCO|nr:unnamed protein product [Mytilus coruscus]